MSHRRQHRGTRTGEGVEVRRSPQAMACRKRCDAELGKPRMAPKQETEKMNIRYTDTEALKGKPGNRTIRQSTSASLLPVTGQVGNNRMPPGSLIRHSTQSMGKP